MQMKLREDLPKRMPGLIHARLQWLLCPVL